MIRYDLVCDKAHEFDGWFSGSAGYDEQVAKKLVACPQCGSTAVSKALMTPGVPAKANKSGANNADATVRALHGPMDPKVEAMVEAVRELRQHVADNADYVGDKFAESARRMHYGEEETRGIYGEASMDDAKELHEEGIEIMPLPGLPEDRN